MEEVLDTGFVPDETETFIDKKPSDGTRRHTRILRGTPPRCIPGAAKLLRRNGPEDAARNADKAPTCRSARTPRIRADKPEYAELETAQV
jgi:hypothetical protein